MHPSPHDSGGPAKDPPRRDRLADPSHRHSDITQQHQVTATRPLPSRHAVAAVAAARRYATQTVRAASGLPAVARATGQAATGAGRTGLRGLRRLTHAQGAGESGLGRVTELHLVATAADTLILTALATTIFFAVPTQQARGRVATSLLVTMVPFVVLAPVVGPMLDRFRHGRRYALATTMVVRAFLAWVMAGAVSGSPSGATAFSLYPAAFGFLVCQKAYVVTRAAALPRVLPPGVGLVTANSRISLAGAAAMTVAAPVGAGITAWLGPSWTLRLAFAVFATGTALALTLSPRVDSREGEAPARIRSATRRPGTPLARAGIGPHVVLGLRANAAMRAFTGFLTLFLAFRLRQQPLGDLRDTAAVALVVALAAIGGGIGTALAAALRRLRPEMTVLAVVAGTTVAAAWSALDYGMWPVLAIAFLSGLGQSLAKLCLDALIQHHVAEHVRTSAFARSETLLQLTWVAGGGLGLVLPLSGAWGLGVAAAAMAAATSFAAIELSRLDHDPSSRRPGSRSPGRPSSSARGSESRPQRAGSPETHAPVARGSGRWRRRPGQTSRSSATARNRVAIFRAVVRSG